MTRSDLIIINKTDLAPMVGAGLLDGDTFQGKMVFGQNSDVTFLSQSYEKVFCTKGNGVVKNVYTGRRKRKGKVFAISSDSV